MTAVRLTISLEPLNEPERKHWCDVGSDDGRYSVGVCLEQVLFHDEAASKLAGREVWVCWAHGQLAFREVFNWWKYPSLLDAVVRPPI